MINTNPILEIPAPLQMFFVISPASDIDEYLQNNLSNISDCQTEIEALNKQANNEILKVEKIYNHLRLPVYAKRNEHIAHIPYFWCTVVRLIKSKGFIKTNFFSNKCCLLLFQCKIFLIINSLIFSFLDTHN